VRTQLAAASGGAAVPAAPGDGRPDRMPAGPAVVVAGLRKSYGSAQAVRGVSFTVAAGEIFALLGPNGAGKTTTLEILEGFRRRDAGQAEVLGYDPGSRAAGRALREQIGLVLQDIAVEPYLTVGETLARNAGYYPEPRPVSEVIAMTGLAGLERKKVRSLSGGQQRRLDLALGLIGRPRLLFLDEPTTGFDPSARRSAWDLIRSLRDAGTTILLTTHYLEEAQELADRVAVLAGGQIVAQGTPSDIGGRDRAAAQIRFALPDGAALTDLPPAVRAAIAAPPADAGPAAGAGQPGAELVTVEAEDLVRLLHELTGWALQHGSTLRHLTVDQPSLESVYLRLTAGPAAGGAEQVINAERTS
jgi:ABC-2 type transport system ATP-binding protein